MGLLALIFGVMALVVPRNTAALAVVVLVQALIQLIDPEYQLLLEKTSTVKVDFQVVMLKTE